VTQLRRSARIAQETNVLHVATPLWDFEPELECYALPVEPLTAAEEAAIASFEQDEVIEAEARVMCKQLQDLETEVSEGRFQLNEHGVLHRYCVPAGAQERLRQLVVLPSDLVPGVLEALHEDALGGGHLGAVKVMGKVASRFWWPGWARAVRLYVGGCQTCQTAPGGLREAREPMQNISPPRNPFDMVGVDATGPLPITLGGNRYIIVFTDYATKWCEAFAVPNIEAATVARLFIDEVVCRHGCPREVLSDNGQPFSSQLVTEIMRQMHVRKLCSAKYHPRTNGAVERLNRTLKLCLGKYVAGHQRDWDVYLPMVLFAYRTAMHTTCGATPFELLYGREPTLPIDVEMRTAPQPSPRFALEKHAVYHRQFQVGMDELLTQSQEITRMAQAERADRRLKRVPKRRKAYAVGDRVWLYVPPHSISSEKHPVSDKLKHPWTGPYRISQIHSPLSVDLVMDVEEHADHRPHRNARTIKQKRVHIDRLKRRERGGGRPRRFTAGLTLDQLRPTLGPKWPEDGGHRNRCNDCNWGGELILCDWCNGVSHLECAGLNQIPEGDWACSLCVYEAESERFGLRVRTVIRDGVEVEVEEGDASRLEPTVYVSRHFRLRNNSNRLELVYELTTLPDYQVDWKWVHEIDNLSAAQQGAIERYDQHQQRRYGRRWAEAFAIG
jgi:hypothetical protein